MFLLWILTGIILLVGSFIMFVRYRKAIVAIAQLEVDKATILAELDRTNQELANTKLGESEEFVKFLSQSRQWAFTFIENFQESLVDMFESLDHEESFESTKEKFIALRKYLPDTNKGEENENQ